MRRRDGWIFIGGEITPRGQTDGGCNEALVYKRVSAAVSRRYATSHGVDGGGGGSSKMAACLHTWERRRSLGSLHVAGKLWAAAVSCRPSGGLHSVNASLPARLAACKRWSLWVSLPDDSLYQLGVRGRPQCEGSTSCQWLLKGPLCCRFLSGEILSKYFSYLPGENSAVMFGFRPLPPARVLSTSAATSALYGVRWFCDFCHN